MVGNFANRISPSLNLTADALNRGRITFGGLGTSRNNAFTFGLANALRNANKIGFNSGLGLNNGLGFNNVTTLPSLGNPLTNRLGFDVLGLDQGPDYRRAGHSRAGFNDRIPDRPYRNDGVDDDTDPSGPGRQ